MRATELLRLVGLNINQNKFKSVMTSIGIVVGAATIVLVIAIGRGGQMDVAEQFASLNAGAIDVSYEWEGDSDQTGQGGFSLGGMMDFFSSGFGGMMGGRMSGSTSGDTSGGTTGGGGNMGGFPGGFQRGGTTDDSGEDSGTSDFGGGEMPDFGSGEMPDFEGGELPGSGTGDAAGELPDFENGDAADEDAGEGEDRGADTAQTTPGMTGEEGTSDNLGASGGADASGNQGTTDEEGASGSQKAAGEEGVSEEQEGAGGEVGSEADASGEAESEEETEDAILSDRLNQENVILTIEDVEDIENFVPGITGTTISYSTRASVEGGNVTDAETYTVAGVKNSYFTVSNLELAAGEFISDNDDSSKSKVCVLGSTAAKEVYGSAESAVGNMLYIDDRAYEIIGVLKSSGTVSAGITPDEAVFVPYETGIKYIAGENISPTITVIAEDVNDIDGVTANIESVLAENYSTAEFTFSDAGSEMEAAEASNQILTLLLAAMAAIVFVVGGIGIMNVLFVSVKERTNEIGILKSLGASRRVILFEFLLESAAISLIGGILGVALSFGITPIVELYDIRVEANAQAWLAALGFAVLTGTLFGIYPAWKASRLVPVEALNAE